MLRSKGVPDFDQSQMVFLYKGKSQEIVPSDKHYCSIRAQLVSGSAYPKFNEIFELTQEIKEMHTNQLIASMAQLPNLANDINCFDQDTKDRFKKVGLLSEPQYRWIDIRGTKAIEISYRRSSLLNTTTRVLTYRLFNTTVAATITLGYREQEEEIWKDDFEYIIQTFEWIHKY